MLLSVRRSILRERWIVVFRVFSVCTLGPLALAQHPGGPAVRPAGPPMHIAAPPVSRMPAPIVQPPIFRAPVSVPRSPAVPFASAPGTVVIRPLHRPIRPFPPVIVVFTPSFLFGSPLWGPYSCWSANCDFFWPGSFGYTTLSSPGPINYVTQVYQSPVYIYGGERPDLPQLLLKDGTILNVTDYWVVDGQLHFVIMEDGGTKSEQVIPFDELDLQKTVDRNTQRGFRFMLRNEPFEQYIRDHPEGPPPVITPPHQ